MLIVHSASPFMETISAAQMQGNIPSLIIHTSIIYEKSEDAASLTKHKTGMFLIRQVE